MEELNNFIDIESLERRSSGILYINIYPVAQYPKKIKVSKKSYDESFSPGRWRKRMGNTLLLLEIM